MCLLYIVNVQRQVTLRLSMIEQMDLNKLALEEYRILAEVRSLGKLIEEKHAELQRRGIFDRYGRVYNRYAALAVQGDLEALKRALFLCWFEVAEPSFLTGITELNGDKSWYVLEYLDRLASTNKLDKELRWMLPHYYAVAGYFFDLVLENALPALRQFLAEKKNMSFPCEELLSSTLEGRGQMADYWQSLRQHCEEVV